MGGKKKVTMTNGTILSLLDPSSFTIDAEMSTLTQTTNSWSKQNHGTGLTLYGDI